VNLIAHTVWRGAPLDGSVNAGALLLGLMVHMMVSAMLGIAIVVVARGATHGRGSIAAAAFGVTAAAYIAQLVLWHAVDHAAATTFTGWIFAVGHVVYAMTAAAALTALAHEPSPTTTVRLRAHA
jgi:hypothetical protein